MSTVNPGGDDTPLVTAILPLSDPRRVGLARHAVNWFMSQAYDRKQLVIANASGTPVTNQPHPAIKELMLALKRPTTGGLRNAALDHADGTLIVHWDDDDYYHPFLLAYHVAHRRPGHASLLTSQIRFNYRASYAYMHYQPEGIVATICYPRTQARFQLADRGETEAFWIEHWGMRTHIVRNHVYPASGLSIAVYHGLNAALLEEFMVGHSDPMIHTGKILLQAPEANHLRESMKLFGMEIEERLIGDEDAA